MENKQIDKSENGVMIGSSATAFPPRFNSVKDQVFMGTELVGRMRSHTMARRTANALNKHIPNSRGV